MTTTKRNNRKSTAALASKPTRSTKTAKHSDDSCTSGGSGTPFKRSRSGCYTCRVRRKKCDESHGKCTACTQLNIPCEWKEPKWWKTVESRKAMKDQLKELIKQTRSDRKPKKMTTVFDSAYAGLPVFNNYDHTYDSFNAINGTDRYYTPDNNLHHNMGFEFNNSQAFDLLSNNHQSFDLINNNNSFDYSNPLTTYDFNIDGSDPTQIPCLTPDATPGYETPEDLTYDNFEGWVHSTPPQAISFEMPYDSISNVNVPGCHLNVEQQIEYNTMPALYTQQNVDSNNYQLSTSVEYQYQDVPDPWAWGAQMIMEGTTHTASY